MSGGCLEGVWEVSAECIQGINMVSRQYKDGVWRPTCIFNLRIGKDRTGQVKKGQVWTSQVRTGQVRTCQIRTGQVRLCHVRTGQVMTSLGGTDIPNITDMTEMTNIT